jgi:hypothetical protein
MKSLDCQERLSPETLDIVAIAGQKHMESHPSIITNPKMTLGISFSFSGALVSNRVRDLTKAKVPRNT